MSDLDKFNYECEGQMSLFEGENHMKEIIIETTVKVTRVLRECPDCFEVDPDGAKEDMTNLLNHFGFDNIKVEDVKVFELEEKA